MKKYSLNPVLSFFFFLSLKILLFEMGVAQNTAPTIPVNVGVVLDLDDLNGKIALSCINTALSDFYASHGSYKTRLVLKTRNSNKDDVVGAAAAALDLIKNEEVQAILGPTTSMQARFVSDLGEKAKVPIISFSATSPSLNSTRNSYFLRATQNDSAQVNAISAIVEAFGWREAVPIYIDNEHGEGIIPYLIDALQEVDARVPYRSVISPSATDGQIAEELYKLMTMQTRVFIVHMNRSLGTRLFTKAKEIGMMSEGYVWIMTDGPSVDFLSSPNHSVTDTVQGVLGIKPYVPRTKELEYFRARWKRKFLQDNPDKIDAELNIYGLLAYDATTALALAVKKSGATNFAFQKANVSSNPSTDLATLGTSLNGPKVIGALSNTSFKGLTGDYLFVDGQLQSPALRIVNVNGNGERGIGFWTPAAGLVKELNPRINKKRKPEEPVLDWTTRKRVALGAARGLEYLHEHCNPKIIHRDVKAANVLLDEDFEAVVGDFGLAKLMDVRKTNVTTQVRGTMGHIAPEYLSTGKSSGRTDVFGYGIMLLELVTGQRAIDFSRLEEEDDVLLLDHVKKLEREKRLDAIVDRNLNKNYNIQEVEMMIKVALLCTQASPEDRPAMSEVVRMLEGEGLAERWEEWQHVEVTRREEYSRLQRRFDLGEDSLYNQSAIELSGGR